MLVFVHINKTAGSTVRYILRSSYGSRHCDVEPWEAKWSGPPFSGADLRRIRRLYRRLASIAGHRVAGDVDLQEPGLRYFTLIRDPLKMCASRFQYQLDHRHRRGLEFEDWIQRDWVRDAQATRIAGRPSAEEAIGIIERREMFVGLTERFDESMVLLRELRAPDLDIAYTRVNVAKRNTTASDLLSDEGTRRLLIEANREDLALYEHVCTVLYPRQQREYGPSLEERVAAFQAQPGKRFNRRNLLRCRLKRRGVYGPMLRLYRRPSLRRVVRAVLG